MYVDVCHPFFLCTNNFGPTRGTRTKIQEMNLHGGRLAEELRELSLGGLEGQVADKDLVAILLNVNLSGGSGIAHGFTGRTFRTGWRGEQGGTGQGTCKGTRKGGTGTKDWGKGE